MTQREIFYVRTWGYHYSLQRLFTVLALVVIVGCSSAKHLQEGETILRSVKLVSTHQHVNPAHYRSNIHQEPNAKWFSLCKVPLGIYCLSGQDSTKRINRVLQRMGEAPVVYSPDMTSHSAHSLQIALQGKGYLQASVKVEALTQAHKTDVVYTLYPGQMKYVGAICRVFDSPTIARELHNDTVCSLLYHGMPLDVSLLEAERKRIVKRLRDLGFYKINKDFISFTADTTTTQGTTLTMHFEPPQNVDTTVAYKRYTIRHIHLEEATSSLDSMQTDTSQYGFSYYYHNKLQILRNKYDQRIHLRPDSLFRETQIQSTYAALHSLTALDFSTLRFIEQPSGQLDVDVVVRPGKRHAVSLEVEGTNTSGDLGVAVVAGYTNRNAFRGSETFTLKARGAYEAITGLEGYSNQNFVGFSLESALKFPGILFPGIANHLQRRLHATSEVGATYDSQDRPEFHRRMIMAEWGYRWQHRDAPKIKHRFDLVSLNYVFMPWISNTFRTEYLEGKDPHYAILRYSYEDLLIMKMGYSLVYNSQQKTSSLGLYQTNGYQIRFAVETAGNLLHAVSKLTHAAKNEEGQYKCFNIAYSQYAKVDIDYSKSFRIDERNSIALHAAMGIAIPYGNADILPYEKRYFSGGANSVRGWGVRELGPGTYKGKDGKIDFINQTGNLKLDFSVEYRTRLLGMLHGAVFIDAGNIWNTKNYADQPGGCFRLNSFYREIAVAYGIGLRANLNYFVLRVDGGMKAINPAAKGEEHYPIARPRFSRDFTLHIAVGMPF